MMKKLTACVASLVLSVGAGFALFQVFEKELSPPLNVPPIAEFRVPEVTAPVVQPEPQGKIAIVIDDWGYNLKAYEILEKLDRPLNLAVLPHLPYTRKIARGGSEQGHEILLHMPMEPLGEALLEENTLMTEMNDEDMEAVLAAALENIPEARGVSNHMGSKFTQDTKAMQTVLKSLEKDDFFYLDSMTISGSVSSSVARDMSLPVMSRDVFLDNELSEEHIQKKLDELIAMAKSNGFAIGIGHDEPMTLEMIRANIARFDDEGIELVKLSDMIQDAPVRVDADTGD